jgi:cell wall-associated NlpC family hydrolase
VGANVASEHKAGIAWGEDCRWKRHFDCIGFINYVFNHTTHNPYNPEKPWSANIQQWYDSTQEVKKDAPTVPADILFRGVLDKDTSQMKWDHIALLTEDRYVAQAEQAVKGVHDDEPYHDGNSWTARRRLGDQYFA